MRFCLSDLASAGSRRGAGCYARQGAELWHHLAGEREDHRAGVQEPAILPAAQSRQRHPGWVNDGHLKKADELKQERLVMINNVTVISVLSEINS